MVDHRPHLVFCYRFGLLGGVVSQLRNRLEAFTSRYRVSFLFQEDHGVARFLPAESIRIVTRRADAIEAFHTLRPDVVAVIDSPWFLDPWREAGRPGQLLLEVHTTYTTTGRVGYLDELTAEHEIAGIVTVSEAMRRRLEQLPVAALAPIHVVPNCLDARWHRDGPRTVAGRKPIVWVGKLDGHKRWRTALHLTEEILRDRLTDDAAGLFIGGYTAGPDNFRGMAMRLTRSRPLSGSTWWPAVPYELMPDVLRSAGASGGVKLATTRDESFGMSVAESVVSGLPVIAPRIDALEELLPACAFYEPGDRNQAATLVHAALDDEAFREELLSTREAVLCRTTPRTALEAFDAALSG